MNALGQLARSVVRRAPSEFNVGLAFLTEQASCSGRAVACVSQTRNYHKNVRNSNKHRGRRTCTAPLASPRAQYSRLRISLTHECTRTLQVVDHYENPQNVGSLDKSDVNVGTGLVGAPACGDVMKLQIRCDEDGNIVEAKFKTFGCGSAIASSSVATEWVKGKNVEDALKMKNSDIAKHLNLPPVKLHCSMLAEEAVQAAIDDYKKKKAGASA